MKANGVPENLYFNQHSAQYNHERRNDDDIEYTRTDAFIEKARKWFEQQPETYDANGVRVYGEEDFEGFKKYIKGE